MAALSVVAVNDESEQSFRELLSIHEDRLRKELVDQLENLSSNICDMLALQQQRIGKEVCEHIEKCSKELREKMESTMSRRPSAKFPMPRRETTLSIGSSIKSGRTTNAIQDQTSATLQQNWSEEEKKNAYPNSPHRDMQATCQNKACRDGAELSHGLNHVLCSADRKGSKQGSDLISGEQSLSSGRSRHMRDVELSLVSSQIEEALARARALPGMLSRVRSSSGTSLCSSGHSSTATCAKINHAVEVVPRAWSADCIGERIPEGREGRDNDDFQISSPCSLKTLSLKQAELEVVRFENTQSSTPVFVRRDCWMRLSFFCLRVFGNLPWQHPSAEKTDRNLSSCYQMLIVFIVVISLGLTVVHVLLSWTSDSCGVDDSQVSKFLALSLGLGSVLGVFSVGMHQKDMNLFAECIQHLEAYAHMEGLQLEFSRVKWDLLFMVGIWLSATSISLQPIASISDNNSCALDTASAALFAIPSGILLALAFSIQILNRATNDLIDTFCLNAYTTQNLNQIVKNWTTLSAMMRKIAIAFEWCFVVVNTAAVSIVLLYAIEVVRSGPAITAHFRDVMPWILIAIGIARAFLIAGSVTDRCACVPAMINGITFGKYVDPGRHCVVDYIARTSSGFNVLDIPITRAMGFKFIYVIGMMTFATALRILSHA